MSLVVDASVAVKWVMREEHDVAARRIALHRRRLLAPDLMWLEVAAGLRRYVRRGDLSAADYREAITDIAQWRVTVRRSRPLMPSAADIALELDHGFYDCVYLALAQAESCAMVTADARLHAKIEASRRRGLTVWIEDAA